MDHPQHHPGPPQPGPPQPPPSPVAPVRSPPAIFAPFFAIGRELRGLFSVPLAFLGGLFGALVLSAALVR